jgi:tetratricopeptide (TPR) repeat protein
MFLSKIFNFIPRNEFSRALDYFNKGEHARALQIFESLLLNKSNRENLDVETIELYACEAHVELSKHNSEMGNLEIAIQEMDKAVKLKPHFADLRYNLGCLYVQAKKYEEASEHFNMSLEINPKFFKARINSAKVFLLKNDIQAAGDELALAEEACPHFYKEKFNDLMQTLRVKGRDDSTERLFREILEERPSSAQISRELAVEAIQNSNYTEAIRELKKAIAINPDYPDLHNYLGIAYGNSGMGDDAIEEFKISLKINPYYLKARLNLALALYEKGQYQEAQNHLTRVLEIQPQNQLANNLLSELNAVKDR